MLLKLSVPLLKMSASPAPFFQLPVLQSSPRVTVADMINNNKHCNYLRKVLMTASDKKIEIVWAQFRMISIKFDFQVILSSNLNNEQLGLRYS